MIDLNNPSNIDKLKSAALNPSGKLIIRFLEQQLEDVSFKNIDKNKPNDLVGQDFKVVMGIREFISNVISLLTPEKGD